MFDGVTGKPAVVFTGATRAEAWPLIRDHHYSGRIPCNVQHIYAARAPGGLFGDTGEPLAVIVFSVPARRRAEKIIELSRLVRLPDAQIPLTQLIAFGCKHLRRQGWSLVISFADWTQNHHGGIYQAAGWNYDGQRPPSVDGLMVDGNFVAWRTAAHRWGTPSFRTLRRRARLDPNLRNAEILPHYDQGKHLYWKALTVAGASRARRLRFKSGAYPKPRSLVHWFNPPQLPPMTAAEVAVLMAWFRCVTQMHLFWRVTGIARMVGEWRAGWQMDLFRRIVSTTAEAAPVDARWHHLASQATLL